MLASRWFPWALVVVLALVLGGLEVVSARHEGEDQAREEQAAAAARAQHVITLQTAASALGAKLTADSLRKVFRAAAPASAVARARADSSATSSAAVRDSALKAAADSATTAAQLREDIRRLAAAQVRDSVARAAERLADASELAKAKVALVADTVAINGYVASLEQDRKDYTALEAELMAVKANRPGLLRRALHGELAAGAGLACGAVGYLGAGPVGAAGGAVLCSALVGAFSP